MPHTQHLYSKPGSGGPAILVRTSWSRKLAAGLALCLLWPHLGWAFEPGLWAKPKASLQPIQTFSIPSQFAQIDQRLSAARPNLIHIQDLHCQYETQANIAQLLEYLQQHYGFSLILMEGASQGVNVTKLSTFPDAEVRREAGQYLMRQGKMSGAEYYAATSAQSVRLEGIEQDALYQEERTCIKQFHTFETEAAGEEIREALNRLKPAIYSERLLALDHFQSGYVDGTISLLGYGHALNAYARNHGKGPAAPAGLARFLDQNRAEGGPDTDFETLGREALQWQQGLRAAAYDTEAERALDQHLRRFSQIEACLNLAGSYRDLTEIRLHRQDYRLSEFSQYLAAQGGAPDSEDIQTLELSLAAALHFYDLADQRTLVFARKVGEIVRDRPGENVVLLTGGYHTALLTQCLQKDHLPYCSLKLRQPPTMSENPYTRLLDDPHCLLEKIVMPPTPAHLALPPYLAQTPNNFQILDEHRLSAEMVRAYEFLEGLLKALTAAKSFSYREPSLENLRREYANLLAHYPANAAHCGLDFDHARAFSRAVLLPLSLPVPTGGPQPFIVIYSQASRVALPSPVSLLTIHGNRLAFYPGAMRAGVEKNLRDYPWEKKWKIAARRMPSLWSAGLRAPALASRALREFSITQWRALTTGIWLYWQAWSNFATHAWSSLAAALKFPTGNRPLPHLAQNPLPAGSVPGSPVKVPVSSPGKTTVLPVFTELLGDLKLAAGLFPILQHLSTHPPSWAWTAVSFAGVIVFLSLGSVFANWFLARKQNRTFSFQEIRRVVRKEWTDYRQGWIKAFKDFLENRRFQPKASWLAMGLLITARGFDYGTQVFNLSRLPLILAYSGFGLGVILAGWLALRGRRKTAWFSEVIGQSLRIVGAVVVVQVLKLPFALALATAGASQIFADRFNDAFLKWLKKVVGVLSFAELFTSLRTWILKGRPRAPSVGSTQRQIRGGENPYTIRHLAQRLWHLVNPQNPVSQLLYLFIFANILFMNFYFALPLQVLTALQLGMGVLLLLNWLLIFKNVQVSQKVKLISLTGILPAALISAFQTGILLLSLGSAVFAQHVPPGLGAALQNFSVPTHLGELAGFVAMMYSLLGFSSIMKDQTKFEQAPPAPADRLAVIQDLVWKRLDQAAPRLAAHLTAAQMTDLKRPLKMRLFSNNGQPEWLKEFFQAGLHVYKENVYMRRRTFNLLNDQTVADLIFQKILKRKLSPEIAESLALSLTGRSAQQDEMLLTRILQGGTSQEMDLAIALINNKSDRPGPEERAGLQRSALEKRFQVRFPVAVDAYRREFAGSWTLLNDKMKIIEHFGIPAHPYFLRLSLGRLQKLGQYLSSSPGRRNLDFTACRKIIETGVLDAQAGFMQRWGMRLTLHAPVVLRGVCEGYWLQNHATAYLGLILAQDHSRLANRLRDRRTSLARTYAGWAAAPDEETTRELVRQVLDELNRPHAPVKESLASLATFSALSRALAVLAAKPCGTWTPSANAPTPLWTPRLLWEPGSRGLRGALFDLLKTLPSKLDFELLPPSPRPRWLLLDMMA